MRLIVLFTMAMASMVSFSQTLPKIDDTELRVAFAKKLKDSESARFQSVNLKQSKTNGMWSMCGHVNAKNSYGAYSGFEPFFASVIQNEGRPKTIVVLGIGDAAGKLCAQEGVM